MELPNKTYLPNFNYDITLLGGQSFSWDKLSPDLYLGVTDNRAILLRPDGEYFHWQTYPEPNDEEFINRYFQTDLDYESIVRAIAKDEYVSRAINRYPGIRVLRQPFDLTVLSFIISANNNIKSIRKSFRKLAQTFGGTITLPSVGKVYLFPTTAKMAEASIDDILKSSVGFRAKYLKETAAQLQESRLSERYGKLSEEELRAKLLQLRGVGEKIADCVLAFSAGFANVTPMDVWGKRILVDLYGLPDDLKYEDYRAFAKDRFEGYALYAGQFLFEWYRTRNAHVAK